MGKCRYSSTWETNAKYKDWILPDDSNTLAKCKVCNKLFDVGNMGEAALVSHSSGKKHATLMEVHVRLKSASKVTDFFGTRSPTVQSAPVTKPTPGPTPSTVSNFVHGNDILSSEIYWSLNVIQNHYSYRSCENMGDLFKMMCPDSDIASKFACGERKCAYLSTFGIAPYFQSLLLSKVKSETNYVLLFDENLNVHLQSKQMDVHVRFWEADTVATRFYTSVFLGHAKAVDLYDKLRVCCDALGIHGMLQLSMDGPNVNWKAYDTLAKDIDNETHTHLLNVGSCGLHQVHNAIRAGSDKTEWNVEQVLSSLYWLFKDSPARREDYTTVTGSTVFPKQFCKHRWLENVAVIERVLEIWPHIIKFVEAASVKKGDINESKCKSFFVVKDAINDKLFLVKANTFLSVAKVVNPFLTKYQTDMPMLPFLADDLHKTLLSLMDRFMTEQACASSRSITKLLKSDVTDRSVHKDTSKIDIGFTAERMLRALKIEKTVSDKDVYAIKADCKKLLITMVSRLLEKSPIRYGIVRNLAWLNPNMISTDKTECVNQLKKTLQILTDSNHVSECKCDDILQQYNQFEGEVISNQDFLSFDIATSRLDVLMYQVMSSKPKWAELWHVTRKLLLLSHGQASVERGFSINKEIIVENMKEHTLIAQRCITDHLKSVGGATSVTMTKQLLLSAASARQKYNSYLADERAKKEKTNRGEKRKAVMDEIDELKSKRKRTEINRSALLKSADEFAEKAETTGKISFITKSNAFRRSAKIKEDEINMRGSAGIWTASGPPDLSQQLPSPTDPSSQCRVLALSKDGTLLAWSNTENIKIADLIYGEIFHEIAHSRVNELQFSPHGNLLASWEPYRVDRDGDNAVGVPNLHIWDVKTGTLVKKFIQKKQQSWSPQWTSDEVLCARNVNNELHFFEKGDFDTIKEKLHCQKVSQFDIAPCTDNYYLAVYVPGSKGQPSFVRAFLYPNFGGQNTAVANKSFFKAERVSTYWNNKGSSLLVLTSTEMSESSYYGEQGLNYLSIKGEACFVQLSKNGPIYSVEWAPDSSSFCVVYGYMPAKATLFDAKAEPVFDFGTGPRNMVTYNSFGTMLCLAGFGNLRGHMEFWDVRQKKLVNQAQSDDTTYLEWSPDGEHILTGTTSPRLRVNNGYNIWHYTGTLVDQCSLDGQELWEIRWQPALEGTFVRKPIKYKPIESSHFVQHDLPNVTAGVYRPPQARIPGAQPMKNTALHTYEPPTDLKQQQQSSDGISKTAAKNKKKREAKKQKQLPDFEAAFVSSQSGLHPEPMVPDSTGDPEKDKKIKNLQKKIQQVEKLKEQQRAGKPLEKNQLEKLKTESALAIELKQLYLE